MHQRRKLTNIVLYFHLCLNLTNVYIDIKVKILANIRVIANNLFFVLKLCKQFILVFQALQTIFFQISHPPLQKNNGSSLILLQAGVIKMEIKLCSLSNTACKSICRTNCRMIRTRGRTHNKVLPTILSHICYFLITRRL